MRHPIRAIVTAPPYATFLEEVAEHPLVCGLRLNTVMPIERDDPQPVLERLSRLGVPLYVDLKGRQLRVRDAAVPPFTSVRLSHAIEVPTPCTAWFSDGEEAARVLAVDGDRLILDEGPHRVIGPGESVNLPHPELRIAGDLTPTDRAYLKAARTLGLRDIMLSFVEGPDDLQLVRALHPDARIVSKIESRRGLDHARRAGDRYGRLMAARGDLFVEVSAPHEMLSALRTIIDRDPRAIVASRLFPSLARGAIPSAQDLSDAAYLMMLGYRTFMLGDTLCLRRDSVIAALNALEAVAEEVLPARALPGEAGP